MKQKDRPNVLSIEEGCENLLNNLSDHNQVVPMLRSIIMKEWDRGFENILTKFLAHKEETIHEVCNNHSTDFGNSIHEILQMKNKSLILREKLALLNQNIVNSSLNLQSKVLQLQQIRMIQQNLTNCQGLISLCQDTIKLSLKAESLLKEKKYFLCLKSLDKITGILEKMDKSNFKTQMETFIHYSKSRIKEDVITSFNEWNQRMYNESLERGSFYFRQYREQLEYTISALDIDFDLVFEAKSIFELMNSESDFAKKYKEKRLICYDVETLGTKSLSNSTADEFLQCYKTVLYRLLDFFKTEIILIKRNVTFYTENELHELWKSTWDKFDTILKTKLSILKNPTTLFELKNFLNTYKEILSSAPLNFETKNVDGSFKAYLGLYFVLIEDETKTELNTIYPEKLFSSFTIQNQGEYIANVERYGLDDPEMHDADGKINFPLLARYGESVPLTCKLIEKVIIKVSQYLGTIEVDKATSSQITDVISKTFRDMASIIDKFYKEYKAQSVSQIELVAFNMNYMAKFCVRLEQIMMYISKDKLIRDNFDFTSPTMEISLDRKLENFEKSKKLCLKLSQKALDTIYDIIELRFREYLKDISKWGWNGSDVNFQQHEELEYVLEFLQTMPSTMQLLTENEKNGVYFVSLVKLDQYITSSLCSPAVPKINMIGIFNWNMDIIALESFADSTGIPDLKECFKNTRNICDLLMSGDIVKEYQNKRQNNVKLDIKILKSILEKYIEVNTDKLLGEDSMISLPRLSKSEKNSVLKLINNK